MAIERVHWIYWLSFILAILGALVIGLVFGYTYCSKVGGSNTTGGEANQPEASSNPITTTTTSTDVKAVFSPRELHAYTGTIQSLTTTTMSVTGTNTAAAWPAQLEFALTTNTQYTALIQLTDAQLLPVSQESALTHDAIHPGDLVTVYSADDMRTSPTIVATKIQKVHI